MEINYREFEKKKSKTKKTCMTSNQNINLVQNYSLYILTNNLSIIIGMQSILEKWEERWVYDIQSIVQTQYQQGFETQRSGDISKATEVKSQLQPLTAESEAPVTLSFDTKTEDGNSVRGKEQSQPQPEYSEALQPCSHLSWIDKQIR